ncbi:MAG: hypothetical protein K1X66_00660 [Verrucomicrobiae bacterium]|nr:hypothetical protein [Verrucomicrobiae bacterium]
MSLPQVFHFYLLGFLAVVILLWIRESIRHFLRRKENQQKGKCPVCAEPWRGDENVFQNRCEHCGARLIFHHH